MDPQSGASAQKDFEQAQQELDRGNVLAALACLERALAIWDDPLWHSRLAYCIAKERGHLTRAFELCRAAIANDPKNPVHYLYLGKVYQVAANQYEALQTLRQGMALGGLPDTPQLFPLHAGVIPAMRQANGGGDAYPLLVVSPNDGWDFHRLFVDVYHPTFAAAAGAPDIKEKLLKGGVELNGRTYKNHLDSYNLLDYVSWPLALLAGCGVLFWRWPRARLLSVVGVALALPVLLSPANTPRSLVVALPLLLGPGIEGLWRLAERHAMVLPLTAVLGLATLAGYLPKDWDVALQDEHVEKLELDDSPDIVVIQVYITSARRALRASSFASCTSPTAACMSVMRKL